MSLKSDIKKINEKIVQETYEKYHIKGNKLVLQKKDKIYLTAKIDEHCLSCFMRFYIDENINICIRIDKLNMNEEKQYSIFTYDENTIYDLDLYENQLRIYLDYMVYSFFKITVCPEHRMFITPINYDKSLDGNFFVSWENRMLKEIILCDNSATEWIDRCVINSPKEFQTSNKEELYEFILKNKKIHLKNPLFNTNEEYLLYLKEAEEYRKGNKEK